MNTDCRDVIKSLLQPTIAFKPIFAKICGSSNAALMLSQIHWYCQQPETTWYRKSVAAWTEHTGLSRWEQETAKAALLALHFIEIDQTPGKIQGFRSNEALIIEAILNGNHVGKPRGQNTTNHEGKPRGDHEENSRGTTRKNHVDSSTKEIQEESDIESLVGNGLPTVEKPDTFSRAKVDLPRHKGEELRWLYTHYPNPNDPVACSKLWDEMKPDEEQIKFMRSQVMPYIDDNGKLKSEYIPIKSKFPALDVYLRQKRLASEEPFPAIVNWMVDLAKSNSHSSNGHKPEPVFEKRSFAFAPAPTNTPSEEDVSEW